ncbi:MAG TPA: glycosyltransferase family 39 protein [Thermoanaerobaculia bacterium]|jgi:hypothetical protein
MVPLLPRLPSPDPLTPLQRRTVAIFAAAIGLTRLFALQQSPWDWDEGLFTAGVREFDPSNHWPHPPGYPLFIAAAKFFHLFGIPEFRSLQCVVLLGAFLVFPACFLFARALGFGFRMSIAAAALFAFLPNVWVYSGTGFSDIPGIALALLACAFLLRGCENDRAYLIGTIILAISIGIRPQNILIGVIPGGIATWMRIRDSWKTVLVAALLGIVIVGATYLGAGLASSSLENYRDALEVQRNWVRDIDSWRSPTRPPLARCLILFFLIPITQKGVMLPLLLFGALSLVMAAIRRDARIALAVAVFLPVAVFSWLNLDISTIGRYAIAYMPLYALLAVDGMERVSFGGEKVATGLVALLIAGYAVWLAPGLKTQLTTKTPPAAAMEWVTQRVPKGEPVFVHGGLRPSADVYLRDYKVAFTEYDEGLPPAAFSKPTFHITDRGPGLRDAAFFQRERGPLWDVVRRRNFVASVTLITSRLRFGPGWHAEESNEYSAWRWMTGEGVVYLPPLPGRGRLSLRFFVPNDSLPAPPTVTIFANGKQLDRFVATGDTIDKSWELESLRGMENEVRITTTGVANPRKLRGIPDDRDLGLRLDSFAWTPIR